MSDNHVKEFNRYKITTVSKRDIAQVSPPEFNANDIESWNDDTIKEVRDIGGDNYDGE